MVRPTKYVPRGIVGLVPAPGSGGVTGSSSSSPPGTSGNAAGTTWKAPVRVATTANGALATAYENGDTVDGVTLATGDRILLKNQTAGAENGIYTVNASGAPTRATDMNDDPEVVGAIVFVLEGTANSGKTFRNTNTTAPIIGTDAITFAELISGSSGTTLPWFIVTDYGAVLDGGTDDQAAVNSAIAALNAAGRGVLYFPAGNCFTSGAFTAITASCLILGDGGSGGDASTQFVSRVTCSSSTAVLFTLQAHATAVVGLALVNSHASPSAGAGIAVTVGGDHNHYRDLSVKGFYINVDIQEGAEWRMEGCHLQAPVLYGLKVRHVDLPDGGDWSISDSWITADVRNGTSAIRVESGGGGKIVNVKINGRPGSPIWWFTNGIDVSVSGSVQTSVLNIANCSIENVSGDAMKGVTTGTARYHVWTITGIQVGLYGNNTGRALNLSAAASGDIRDVVVDGCIFLTDGTARAAIALTNVDNVTLGDIELRGFNARYTATTSTNITDGATPTFVTPAIVLGSAAAAGSSDTVIRSDSTIIAFDATAPSTQGYGDTAATGSAAIAARRDHRHGTPAPSSDHVHIVDERFSGDGSTTVFPLANTAAVDSVMAYVSGARTPVTLGGTLDDEITFGSAPGSGTDNISVDYAAVLT